MKFKKLLAFVLSVVILLITLPLITLTTGALTNGYYTYTVSSGEATITYCDRSISGDVIIPSTLGGYPVTGIGDEAFYGCDLLTSITIPGSIKKIGLWSFCACTSINTVILHDGVTSIGAQAFERCISLNDITIPDSVTNIGISAFWETKYSNNSDNWENGVLYIDNHLIEADETVSYNYKIKNDTLTIANGAFYGCYQLTSLYLSESITHIGDYAFYDCESLNTINIPNGVLSIGEEAFGYCDIVNLTIPYSVVNIGNNAFKSCSFLKSIIVDKDNTRYCSVDDVLFNKEKSILIKYPCQKSGITYTIPDTVTTISNEAFNFCTKLANIEIPDCVTSIGEGAFGFCSSLVSAKLPTNIINLPEDLFFKCTSLKIIYMANSVKQISNSAFTHCDSLWHILFRGTENEWKNILVYNSMNNSETIGSKSDYLANVTIHYNIAENEKTFTMTEPSCIEKGIINCSKCQESSMSFFGRPTGHTFKNDVCIECNKNKLDCIESSHNYPPICDENWVINKLYAKSITITFCSATEMVRGRDYIYIYDSHDNLIGQYTGTDLANKKITVKGDTVKIRLYAFSFGGNTAYGFALSDIIADYSTESGDINNDGETNATDLTLLRQFLLSDDNIIADVNGDIEFDIRDLVCLKKKLVGIIP